MSLRERVTVVLDPRFPGGTAAAAAEELRALAGIVELRVVGLRTAMFAGRGVNPRLQAALDALGLALDWEPRVIRGDLVVLHNPAALKFETGLACRISCDTLVAVAHENPLRPGGVESFDAGHCLALLERATLARRLLVAPVSVSNRRNVADWLARGEAPAWELAPFDWPNVCDFPLLPPPAQPRDRRGRHSRPGLEKFPPLEVMSRHFPSHAERCVILGADHFLGDPATVPRHWTALPFGAMDVGRFLGEIDVFVYFTHPLWRESFGRAVAEAIAAGCLVVTDPATAEPFGPGVLASDGTDVDDLVRHHLDRPERFAARVREAQARLADYGGEGVRRAVRAALGHPPPRPAMARRSAGARRALP